MKASWPGYAAAALIVIASTAPVSAQQRIPGDPYVDDPSGIVTDPCPVRPAAQTDDDRRIAKLHQITRDFAQICRYRQTNLDLLAKRELVKVVFMGDSITDHWIEADPAFFTSGFVDRGIGGQTTAQMLLRFRQDVIALKPRVVHIMAGTNDVAGNTGPATIETVQGNIESMAELARAHGIAVIIASVPPADHFYWSPDKRPAATIRTLNMWLKTYAARKGFTYVDYYAALATDEGAMKPDLAADRVHPTPLGYAVMRPLAVAAIRRVSK